MIKLKMFPVRLLRTASIGLLAVATVQYFLGNPQGAFITTRYAAIPLMLMACLFLLRG